MQTRYLSRSMNRMVKSKPPSRDERLAAGRIDRGAKNPNCLCPRNSCGYAWFGASRDRFKNDDLCRWKNQWHHRWGKVRVTGGPGLAEADASKGTTAEDLPLT